jgi:hypothetical protein
MNVSYGKKVGSALAAVGQLLRDTSRLLQDCDGAIGKWRPSLFGNVVTKDLSTVIYNHWGWMAPSVFRYYEAAEHGTGVVEGVTVYFHDDPPPYDEPLLLVGQVKYRVSSDTPTQSLCQPWDIWYSFFEWGEKPLRLDTVLLLRNLAESRIEWSKVIACPLYSIRSMDDVVALLKKVRAVEPLALPKG